MSELPTGTVTFLFADIEGSAGLWEQHGRAMEDALARYRVLMGAAIAEHGGSVFKMMGDAYWAAFTTAPDALVAALAAQRALLAEPWSLASPPRVRMALHTGAAERSNHDYLGPPLNRAARLLAAGHGGQILLSGVTQELVRDQLPDGIELRDLGERRLKDLARSERIFEVNAPDLPSAFPSLRTLDGQRNNLPLQPTPLIGREREVAELTALLRHRDVRLVTLTGPGGSGKTRLSLQVAADLVGEIPDGVYFVELAAIWEPEQVPVAIGRTLGVKEIGEQAALQNLKAYLRDKQMLLVLDNFEQVAAAAPMLADLLKASAGLKLIVSSRAVLHVYDEHEYPVPPLVLPDRDHLPPPAALSQYAAVALFIQRAQAVRPSFEVTNDNAPAIAEICVRLDGLPLAIELAAVRVKLLSPDALLARLDNRLALLTGGARERTARQQTLRGAIDWSYNLLAADDQVLFARLAVFVSGFTLDAAEAVAGAIGAEALARAPDRISMNPPVRTLPVLDGVQLLADESLLRRVDGVDGEPRFLMLETIHQYALERLLERGELDAVRWQHAIYFLQLAATAEQALRGPRQDLWLRRIEEEHDNLRAALQYALNGGYIELGSRLASALSDFWIKRGFWSEGRRWLETALARALGHEAGDDGPVAVNGADIDPAPGSSVATILAQIGSVAALQRDYRRAIEVSEASLYLCRRQGDTRGIAWSLNSLGWVAVDQGNYERARAVQRESLELFRAVGDHRGSASSLNCLGEIAAAQGDYQRATRRHQEGIALLRGLGNPWDAAWPLLNLGRVAAFQGDYGRASRLIGESLGLFRDAGDMWGAAWGLNNLAWIARLEGDPSRATTLAGESFEQFCTIGDLWGSAWSQADLGQLALEQGDGARASRLLHASLRIFDDIGGREGMARCLELLAALRLLAPAPEAAEQAALFLGAATRLRETIGAPLSPINRAEIEHSRAELRRRLDDDAQARVAADVRTTPLDTIIQQALGDDADAP